MICLGTEDTVGRATINVVNVISYILQRVYYIHRRINMCKYWHLVSRVISMVQFKMRELLEIVQGSDDVFQKGGKSGTMQELIQICEFDFIDCEFGVKRWDSNFEVKYSVIVIIYFKRYSTSTYCIMSSRCFICSNVALLCVNFKTIYINIRITTFNLC